MQQVPNPEQFSQAIVQAMDDLENRTRKIGLYQTHYSVGLDRPEAAQQLEAMEATPLDLLREGAKMMVIVSYNIGDMAFDPAITDPESERINREAQVLLPTEAELEAERIKRMLEEGKDIFDPEDE